LALPQPEPLRGSHNLGIEVDDALATSEQVEL
jgi:hypothetical protein